MKYRLLLSACVLSLGVTVGRAADEVEDEYSPDLGIYASAKNSMRFGFRLVNGADVKFGNLGIVPVLNQVPSASAGDVTRIYNDGFIRKDSARIEETATGTVTLPNGRYELTTTDATTGAVVTIGNLLSFKAGQSRDWRYENANQLTADRSGIIFNSYSAASEGAAFDGKKNLSSGIELQTARILGKVADRWEVSLVGGLALSSISSAQAGSVRSTLLVSSDTFSLLGNPTTPAAGVLQPTFAPFLSSNGAAILGSGLETTIPIGSVPIAGSHTDTSIVGGANVNGVWKMKGAYFAMKIGPEIRTMLTKDIGVSASIGLAGAYVGTNYTALEQLTVAGLPEPIGESQTSDKNKFLPGYYATVDALWQATERAGFFVGATYEGYGDYSQSVGGRTAKVDLSSTAGVHGGISIKF